MGGLEVRGPGVTGADYRAGDSDDPGAESTFHDGWLRTGAVAKLDPLGYITLTDSSTDVIRSVPGQDFAKWQPPGAWAFLDEAPRTVSSSSTRR